MPRTKKVARAARPTRRAARLSMSSTWKDTRRALRSAETTVGRRVAALVRHSGIEPKQVMRQAEAWRARLDREGKKARKRVELRLDELKQRARHDRRALGRAVDDAVARALAALNIPSRHELQQLARRVEQLSERIGSRRR